MDTSLGLAVQTGLAVLAYVLLLAFDCNGPGFTPVLVMTISGHSQSHCFQFFLFRYGDQR